MEYSVAVWIVGAVLTSFALIECGHRCALYQGPHISSTRCCFKCCACMPGGVGGCSCTGMGIFRTRDVRQTFEDYYRACLKMYHLAAEQGSRRIIKGIGRFSIDEFDFDLIVFGLLYEM